PPSTPEKTCSWSTGVCRPGLASLRRSRWRCQSERVVRWTWHRVYGYVMTSSMGSRTSRWIEQRCPKLVCNERPLVILNGYKGGLLSRIGVALVAWPGYSETLLRGTEWTQRLRSINSLQ